MYESSGVRRSEVLSKKYGCGLIRCVETNGTVDKAIHSSMITNDALRCAPQ